MKTSKLLLSAAVVAIAAVPSTLPIPALADTYQIFNLGVANSHSIFGIDTAGAVVIQSPTGPGSALLYQTYVDGILTGSSATIPNLTYDNGSPCTPTVSPGITWVSGLGQTRCNNGHEVYFGNFPTPAGPNPETHGIFTGPNLTDRLTDPALLFVDSSTLDQVVMNGSGDFAWVNGLEETIFEAVDQTPSKVPEPTSLFFLATGSLTLIGAIRRRLG
jgi:hypothetical protein